MKIDGQIFLKSGVDRSEGGTRGIDPRVTAIIVGDAQLSSKRIEEGMVRRTGRISMTATLKHDDIGRPDVAYEFIQEAAFPDARLSNDHDKLVGTPSGLLKGVCELI